MLMRFYVASAYGFLFILSSVYLSVNCTLNHSSMLILKGRHGYYEYRFFILDWIQSHLRCGLLDIVIPIITSLGNGGAIWILCSITLLIFPKTRRAGASILVALILETLCCNLFLKPFVARARPCDVNTAVNLLIARPKDFSFPSGHTGSAFAATAALYFEKSRLWIPAVVLSTLIAFSRLYLYVHYPSDVFAGMMIGIMSGWVGNSITQLMKRQFYKRKV